MKPRYIHVPDGDYTSKPEIARACGTKGALIRKYVQWGKLPEIRISDRVRLIRKEDAEKFIEKHRRIG